MYLLELYQNNYSKDLVLFETLEEGREFVAQIPGYTLETRIVLKWSILIQKIYRIIWRLSSMEILSLYLDFRLILRKMWTLFGKKFRIYPLKTIK